MRRSAVDAILAWHRKFDKTDLPQKLERMAASPFGFFRGTFFLFVGDLPSKPMLKARGLIIGDVHTQNFGSFRSVSGSIVFDINDFDEATESFYEWDVTRLAASLLLSAEDNSHRLGDGVNAAEAAVREWIASLARWRNMSRNKFEAVEPAPMETRLLKTAGERSRPTFLAKLTEPARRGAYVLLNSSVYPPATAEQHEAAQAALPEFLKRCLAPANAKPQRYTFQDVSRRVAGNGSMGRPRFAVLLGKGEKGGESLSSLRLVEWKQSLDSALDSAKPHAGPRRAQHIFESTRLCQLYPKRYLGYTEMSGMPMQAREIGANDRRFSAADVKDPRKFEEAAALFGRTLARCHLLGSFREIGPREIPLELHGQEDAFVRRVLRFAIDYAAQVHEDHSGLLHRRAKLEEAWKPKSR